MLGRWQCLTAMQLAFTAMGSGRVDGSDVKALKSSQNYIRRRFPFHHDAVLFLFLGLGWLLACLLGWLVGWLVGGWLVGLVGWLVGWLVSLNWPGSFEDLNGPSGHAARFQHESFIAEPYLSVACLQRIASLGQGGHLMCPRRLLCWMAVPVAESLR